MPASIYTSSAFPRIYPAGYTGALQYVWIGDSLIAGAGSTESHTVVNAFAWQLWRTKFYLRYGIVAQSCSNVGVGGNTTTQIAARIAADAIALAPSAGIMINGGVNDIIGGVSEATFLSNWTAMLDACVVAGIPPVVLLMGPWSAGSEAQSTQRDSWNASLSSLAAGYQTAVVVSLSAALGQFRAGGPVGNLWDLVPAYSSDGLHLTSAGYTAMAQAVYDALN